MSILDLPLVVVEKIVTYLDTRDKFAAAEATPVFRETMDTQLETTTLFQVKRKKWLLLVVGDFFTTERITAGFRLRAYEYIHLFIPRSVTESGDVDVMSDLMTFVKEATDDGTYSFSTIEVVGRATICGCVYAGMMNFTRSLIIDDEQSFEMLELIAQSVDKTITGKSITYNGPGPFEEMLAISSILSFGVQFLVREDRIFVDRAELVGDLAPKLTLVSWFNRHNLDAFVPSAFFKLRFARDQSTWVRIPVKILQARAVLFR